MRILILGGDGMLGHQLLKHFRGTHETRVTLHRRLAEYAHYRLFDAANAFDEIDSRDFEHVKQTVAAFLPEAIINAVGIVKQRAESAESIPSIEINSLFPHRLALLCRERGIRLVHMSTDCVFSGRKGNYNENDTPDAEDLYGRTKLLGEVSEAPCVTLRTSIIGCELARKTGLLEWFLSQRGPVKGYRHAIFSGFTTIEMGRIIERVLTHRPQASGLFHVSTAAISKYDLLGLIKQKLGLATEILPDDNFKCDRSLESARFQRLFGYAPPTWQSMAEELAEHIKRR
jgi:dTDP-4-dehydrorhamnose reductase